MANFNDITDIFDFSSYYEGDESALHSIEASSLASSPPTLLPDSPRESPSSTLSDPAEPSSPSLTEEEESHYNNLIFFAVDSPVLPPGPPPNTAELSMTFVSPPPFALSPTVTDTSLPSATYASSSPRSSLSASLSPPVLKRRRSLSSESSESQPGPSTPSSSSTRETTPPDPNPRPARRPRLSVPGESAFQLDVQVPAFTSSVPTGPPMGKTRQRVDYSACKCSNRTGKPARHWKTACPYNPARHTNRVSCELCGMSFSRHDNMDRHMEDYH
ncbi:hypothetical protein M407DRAFT_24768 [Tulasnella calospora MUT 4182]|uniref:C2H2-type domain-containing protein n=1 Tax=Tulasnella calospora MUT 4182 TaxID=1051891 RepID=A0A0C3QIS1_9AGAM|nr:hypothetical protein M407DRAFT_24768 [Tulasnella calospora MUT 4182]